MSEKRVYLDQTETARSIFKTAGLSFGRIIAAAATMFAEGRLAVETAEPSDGKLHLAIADAVTAEAIVAEAKNLKPAADLSSPAAKPAAKPDGSRYLDETVPPGTTCPVCGKDVAGKPSSSLLLKEDGKLLLITAHRNKFLPDASGEEHSCYYYVQERHKEAVGRFASVMTYAEAAEKLAAIVAAAESRRREGADKVETFRARFSRPINTPRFVKGSRELLAPPPPDERKKSGNGGHGSRKGRKTRGEPKGLAIS